MKLENKEAALDFIKEIERLKAGLEMMERAKERGYALTFAVSTSDARGFILEDAYLFKDYSLMENLMISIEKDIKELTQKLEVL